MLSSIKNIPLNAGLGGGSSNAAATLHLLNHYYKTKMKPMEMIKFIQEITSDGAFFILSIPSRVRGTGNKISPKMINLKQKVVLIKPNFGFSTKEVYSSLSYKHLRHPNMNKLESYLLEDNFSMFAKHADNSLMDAFIVLESEIKNILGKLKELGFELALMSGSGSTCFAISNQKEPYKKYKDAFSKNDYELVGLYKIMNGKF
jgi:4-diphosphocytidyl-2C-methyl-D-erythritol 2-phosphate synthase